MFLEIMFLVCHSVVDLIHSGDDRLSGIRDVVDHAYKSISRQSEQSTAKGSHGLFSLWLRSQQTVHFLPAT